MRTTIAELVAVLAMDSTRFQQGITKAETSSMRMAKNLGAIGKRMTMMVTLPIVAAGVASTKMAMDFESQMANVFTLMDKATVKSRNWKKEVLDLSKKVPQSTDVLSKGLYDIVSAGIDAGKAMGVLEVSSKAATAGLSTTAVAADAITSILNAYGLEAEQAGDVSDILFTTIRYGKTTFDELGPAVGRVAATASAANVSFEEVGAALATMTISGLKTDEAVVSLNQTILSFLKPTDQAIDAAAEIGFELDATTLATKGLGGAMTELSQKMGITVDDMVEMEQAGLSDAEMYDELALRTGKSAEMMASLFPNIRALKGALILAKNEGAKFNEMLGLQEKRLGATTEAFNVIAETTKFQFDLALSSLKAVAIEMGTHLLPIATELFKKIGEGADAFGELSDSTQKLVINILSLLAILGPLIWGVSGIMKLTAKVKAITTIISKFAVGIGTTIGAIGNAAGLILALANRLGGLTKAFIENTDGMTANRKALETLNVLMLGIPEIFNEIARAMGYQVDTYKYGYGAMIEAVFGFGKAVEDTAETSEQAFENLFIRATEYVRDYAEVVPEATDAMVDLITQINEGAITQEAFVLGVQDIITAYQDEIAVIEALDEKRGISTATLGRLTGATQANKEMMEEQARKLEEQARQLSITSEETYGYAEALRDTTEDVKDFTSALSGMYGQLFAIYLLNIDMEKALEEAEKALIEYSKSVVEHGIDSDKTRQLEEDWIRILNTEAIERIPALITKVGELTDEEVIYLDGMSDLIQKAIDMGIGVEEVWRNMSADIKDKITQSIIPDYALMAGALGIYVKEQKEDLGKLDSSLGITTGKVKSLKDWIDKLKSKKITITTVYKQARVAAMPAGVVLEEQHGGIVPGPIGAPMPAIVHGGEIIINPYEPRGMPSIPAPIAQAIPEMKGAFPRTLLIHNVIEMDKQVLADQMNEIKIDEEATRV